MAVADSSAAAAWKTLADLRQMKGHQFWEAGFSYDSVPHQQLSGHRQVTDAWLAKLAQDRGGRLATLDKGLAEVHHAVAEYIPNLTT